MAKLKLFVYKISKLLGLFRLTAWLMRHRLCILCYHGFALRDEHRFRPRLFIEPTTFARRMQILKKSHPVLPLSEAIELLGKNALPHGAVVITIDDGFYSFYKEAVPILSENHLPATVYLTTYYVQHESPIFRLAVQYIFWKTNTNILETTGLSDKDAGKLDLQDLSKSSAWMWQFIQNAEANCQDSERVEILEELARRLGVDFDMLIKNRFFSLMTGEEARAVAKIMDVQLHTHRHRFPIDQIGAIRELDENNKVLEQITGYRGTHFCYPSGQWSKEHWIWLGQFGLKTAVTCEPGFNTPKTPLFALQRFLDGENISEIEFEAEISGFTEVLRIARAFVQKWH